MRSIVINRQYGSGGREIGKIISEKLNIPFYDSKIYEDAAKKSGLNYGIMKEFDEKLIQNKMYTLATAFYVNPEAMQYPYKLFGAISDTVKDAAIKGPCVFIGRCADKILENENIDFINVYIYADMESRIKYAIEKDKISQHSAQSYVNKKDKTRREYQQFFTNTKFGNMEDYDICFNTSKLGYDKCVDAIINLYK